MRKIEEVARDVFAEGNVYAHKTTKEEIAKIKEIISTTTMTVEEMNKETGLSWRVEAFTLTNHKFAKINGRYWYFKITDKGNVIDYFLITDSNERKYAEIPKHTDEEYHTYSDIGCYLINGLLFRNGIGDGSNTIIVRTVDNKGKYYTKSEIHERVKTSFIPQDRKIKIWKNDCEDISKVKPMLEIYNVIEVQISDTKLYVIKEIDNENI